jgi:hypothetical protein
MFPKPVPVSKTRYGFQNWGEFWKVGGVSKTGCGFQNRGEGLQNQARETGLSGTKRMNRPASFHIWQGMHETELNLPGS